MSLTFAEALSQIKKTKIENNYLAIRFGYSYTYILSYSEGIKVISALDNAEQIYDEYQKPFNIGPIKRDDLKVEIMSREEYENYKLSNLLGLSLVDVVNMRKEEKQKHWLKPEENIQE